MNTLNMKRVEQLAINSDGQLQECSVVMMMHMLNLIDSEGDTYNTTRLLANGSKYNYKELLRQCALYQGPQGVSGIKVGLSNISKQLKPLAINQLLPYKERYKLCIELEELALNSTKVVDVNLYMLIGAIYGAPIYGYLEHHVEYKRGLASDNKVWTNPEEALAVAKGYVEEYKKALRALCVSSRVEPEYYYHDFDLKPAELLLG